MVSEDRKLYGITVSKNYSDLLDILIDENAKLFDKWFIVTQEDDIDTINVIKSKNCDNIEIVYYPLVPSARKKGDAKMWFTGKAAEIEKPSYKRASDLKLTFDKGGGLKTAQLKFLDKCNPTGDDLVLVIDSDVVLPENLLSLIKDMEFENNCIYGAKRADFLKYSDFKSKTNAKPYVRNDAIDGHIDGFFHLYKYKPGITYERSYNCEWVDMSFAKSFEHQKVLDIEVSHLGHYGVNWDGRKEDSFLFDNKDDAGIGKICERYNLPTCGTREEMLKRLEKKINGINLESKSQKYILPRFVLPGFQKCGTTSLNRILSQHTNIQFGSEYNQPVNYFSNGNFRVSNFKRGYMWYMKHFLRDSNAWGDNAVSCFNRGWPRTVEQMKITFVEKRWDWIPFPKFVVMIRNPIDRAYSEYNHFMKEYPASSSWPWEHPARTFHKNIESELVCLSKSPRDKWSTLDMKGQLLVNGVYVDKLSHLKNQLNLDEGSLLVITQESMRDYPQQTFNKIFDFLGVEHQEINSEKHREGIYDSPMTPATRELLENFYSEPNQRLFDFLGYEIEEWKT